MVISLMGLAFIATGMLFSNYCNSVKREKKHQSGKDNTVLTIYFKNYPHDKRNQMGHQPGK